MILTGKLDNKIIHNEKTISDLLGVSRTPVREAMLELSKENIVKYIPGKGLKLNIFTEKIIRGTYEIRKLVEGLIINKVCNKINESEFEKIDKLLKSQIKYYQKKMRFILLKLIKNFTFICHHSKIMIKSIPFFLI